MPKRLVTFPSRTNLSRRRTCISNSSPAKETVKIPVIGSLNGSTPGGWTGYARKIQQAGADALELNIYTVPTDFDLTSEEIEQRYSRS